MTKQEQKPDIQLAAFHLQNCRDKNCSTHETYHQINTAYIEKSLKREERLKQIIKQWVEHKHDEFCWSGICDGKIQLAVELEALWSR